MSTTNAATLPRCCEWRGLFYDDDERVRRCWRHASVEQRQLVAELDKRAPGIGLKRIHNDDDNYGWPYGPNIDVPSRVRMLDWAEANGLRLSRGHECLHWLRGGGYRDCYHGIGESWLDHPTSWNRSGRPAVLIGQPYHLDDEDLAELAEVDADPRLAVRVASPATLEVGGEPHSSSSPFERLTRSADDSWYGAYTYLVAIWRTDALAKVVDLADHV